MLFPIIQKKKLMNVKKRPKQQPKPLSVKNLGLDGDDYNCCEKYWENIFDKHLILSSQHPLKELLLCSLLWPVY